MATIDNNKAFGKWEVIKKIGKGGNGQVYRVMYGNKEYALKSLIKFSKTIAYQRFKDEIQSLISLNTINGVIEIVDYYLPDTPSKDDAPYYVMPLGQEIGNFLIGKSHNFLFESFLNITKAVEELHYKEYTHRDIKPNNILVIDNESVLCDFGLVSFPEKSKLTGKNEKLGPQWTIAPEMKRTSSTAEFKKADIYSLAKTLWILITGSKVGFEGQYILNSSLSLDKFISVEINTMTISGDWHYFSIVKLEELLVKATDNDPRNRPTATEFYKMLKFWFDSNNDFFIRNTYEWEDALKRIFPQGTPKQTIWNYSADIAKVLDIITQYDNSNYCFFPYRGGEDLTSIKYDSYSDYIVINENHILKSGELIFNNLGDFDWSYFRLVVSPQEKISNDGDEFSEEYRGDRHFNYLGELHDSDINGLSITRYVKGSLIIVLKTGKINELKGTYKGLFLDGHSGIHDKISHEEYDAVLAECRKRDRLRASTII